MSAGAILEVAVRKQLGDILIDVAFSSEGRVTALFGPSGSGKTSVVNMIAGLIEPERGRIRIGETVLFDNEHRIAISTHKRRIGYVFQDAGSFPT
jgi:molybdate transport system ATP-binding protein